MVNVEELDDLLGLIADNLDTSHRDEVDERYRRSLACQDVDMPPLFVAAEIGNRFQLPDPWHRFTHYGYRDAFDDPVAMMQNELLDYVVPGLLIKDDSALAIRNNHGPIQIAAALGASWVMHNNDNPWVKPLPSRQRIEEIVNGDIHISEDDGILAKSLAILGFYNQKLAEYPLCDKFIQVSMPDTQGPMDTAEQLWGSDIYLAVYEDRELLGGLLSKIAEVMLAASERFRRYTNDRLDPFANTQHGFVIPGRLLIRDDSSVLLSPDTYFDLVCPHDSRLLNEVGGGSIHFCGNGQHLVDSMLTIPGLRGLDLGQSRMMDVDEIYALCKPRRVAITRLSLSREELITGSARERFPTGVVFVHRTEDIDDAKLVVERYRSAQAMRGNLE